ncbi:xyloglucan O-acetyltransferase 1-like [Miscanthus floridulus]|uniref:xyloglucan O-acetyltransferase 1-like n=1 Tax=Miscanthus floridulus TaxID=154761 RepID=UPI003457E496
MGGAHEPLHPHMQMKTSSSSKGGSHGYFVPRPVCAWLVCGFVALALLHVLCCTPPGTQEAVLSPLLQYVDDTYNFVSSGPQSCNYTEGRWVYAPGHARRYNATECHVKDSHNCIRNGRPDTGYLDWRWQPAAAGCRLPAFSARAFLSAVRGKHVAFVGDSMSRNQAQSLVCLLVGAGVPHRVVYRDADPHKFNLWRYAFPTHGVTVSFYSAPFIARATGKALNGNDSLPQNMNHVHLDALDDRWVADADTMDVVVLSIAHWPLNGAIYYNNSARIGHHNHQELSASEEIGYAWPMKVAYRMALDRLSSGGRPRTVVIATLSPGHFEGNTLTTMCPRKEPYKEGEKEPHHLEMELVRLVYEEAQAARARNGEGGGARVEVLDVTKLAVMRPDGHPGLYMHRDPFAHGGPQPWMPSDCLHFCLPGPVDTFNEILQQILRKKR